MIKQYFITMNPHHIDLNEYELKKDFKTALLKYYRRILGRHFNKRKDEQYKLYVFMEKGKSNQSHLHIMATVDDMEVDNFYYSISSIMKRKYLTLTSDIREIYEESNLLSYLTKEQCLIFSNEDLY